jgi:hypothetical protein
MPFSIFTFVSLFSIIINQIIIIPGRRYKVFVVCLVRTRNVSNIVEMFLASTLCGCRHFTRASSRKLCKDNNLPYICVDYIYPDFSDAVQLIRQTVDE